MEVKSICTVNSINVYSYYVSVVRTEKGKHNAIKGICYCIHHVWCKLILHNVKLLKFIYC